MLFERQILVDFVILVDPREFIPLTVENPTAFVRSLGLWIFGERRACGETSINLPVSGVASDIVEDKYAQCDEIYESQGKSRLSVVHMLCADV